MKCFSFFQRVRVQEIVNDSSQIPRYIVPSGTMNISNRKSIFGDERRDLVETISRRNFSNDLRSNFQPQNVLILNDARLNNQDEPQPSTSRHPDPIDSSNRHPDPTEHQPVASTSAQTSGLPPNMFSSFKTSGRRKRKLT